jgi:putative ABC transport system substrate-binding protein
MRELGYLEGKSIVLEARYAEGHLERLPDLARQLVSLKVHVIVAATDPSIAAARRETQTIPIVMVASSDPVGTGFVASLAKPGRNVTGLSTLSPMLSAKRLELLRQAVPGVSRVALLWNPDSRGNLFDYKETESAARAQHLDLQSVEVSRAEDLERSFALVTSQHAQALVLPQGNPLAWEHRRQITRFAQQQRLPSVFAQREYVEAGGLMSYGPSTAGQTRRAAVYVDKILRGAKPGDLPVEQPTTFELVISLKTAKAIGLAIPEALLQRADEVIR